MTRRSTPMRTISSEQFLSQSIHAQKCVHEMMVQEIAKYRAQGRLVSTYGDTIEIQEPTNAWT